MSSGVEANLKQAVWVTQNLPIRLFGDPILKQRCDEVTYEEMKNGQAEEWVRQMRDFMTAYRKRTGLGRGLAANQIGIAKRLLLIWGDEEPEIFVNPQIVGTEGSGVYPESCISAAGLIIGDVVRPWIIKLDYIGIDGLEKAIGADPISSRRLLHEIDHLNGIGCLERYEKGTVRLSQGKDDVLTSELKRLK